MQSLFDNTEREKIIARFQSLRKDSGARWGKMKVAQMLHHCQAPIKVATGELPLKQSFIGLLFGGMAKKQLLKPGPFKRNLPTAPEFRVVKENYDFDKELAELISLIRKFGETGPLPHRGKHPFFGAMSEQEWDTLQWRHLDHHLTQFGA